MSKKKRNSRHRLMSGLDKISSRIKGQVCMEFFLDRMSPAQRKAFDESWRNTKSWSELTEDQKKACERDEGLSLEEREELKREYQNDQDRRFLQIGMALRSDEPDSELFKTSKEAVDLYNRCKKNTLSVSEYDKQKFYTVLDRYIILLEADKRKRQKEKAGKGGGTPEGRGRKPKHSKKQLKKVFESFQEYFKDTPHKTRAWQLAAEKHKMASGKAAYMACRRYGVLKQNKSQN
jgi:hypothetical protein